MHYSDLAGLLLVGISVLLALGLVTFGATVNNGAGTTGVASTTIVNVICQVFNTIKSIIFILGLTLMILGGALYAGANLMPSQTRGSFQGYGMAMIIGGVIGVAIAVAAPFILNIIISTNPTASTINTTSSSGTSSTTGLTQGQNQCVNTGSGLS